MADSKLSALPDIGTIQTTDLIYVVRAGTSYHGTVAELIPVLQYQTATNFAALPAAASNSGVTYLVLNAQGVIWINRKPAGLYTSDGTNWNYDADQTDAYLAGLTPTNGQIPVGNGTNFVTKSVSGDATLAASGALTLTTVNSNVGSFGSATQALVITVNGKGLITAASLVTITPSVGSIAGLGTGVATALAVNVGSAGAFVVFNGAGGTPSAIVLTNGTGLPISTGITGTGTGVLTALAVNVGSAGAFVTFNGALGTPSSGALTNCTADGTNAVGFRGVPPNSQSSAYTTVLTDNGKHIYHPSADTTPRIWTIDSNANVAYLIGSTITFINDASAGVITIAITSDTMVLAGAGSTGSRTLAANGIATAVKMTSTRWIINGTGLT